VTRRVRASLLAIGAMLLMLGLLASPALAQDALLAQSEIEQGLTGTLRDGERNPVPGVTIVVSDASGNEVGTAETDDEGRWELAVDQPGVFQVFLDPETLPEGVDLRDPDENPLEIEVLPGRVRPAVFQLGEGEAGRAQLDAFFRAFANGLKFGLIIAMCSVGLSLIFGTTGLINFAHGELVAFGALFAWFLNVDSVEWHLFLAALMAVVVTSALGASFERGVFRPLRRRRVGLFQLMIVSIGLSLFIRHLLLLFFGGAPRPYADFVGQSVVRIGPIALTPRDMTIMAISVVILVGVGLMLQTTRIGKAMRAVADNRDLAESSGIDVNRVILIVWIVGAGLAALGGILFGSAVAVDWFMGFRLLLLMFAGVILGGLGTAYGAMVGSIVIGLVTELSVLWFPAELKFMWALVVLVVVLLVRPQGILGRAERIG
jgi:neutral amino acid transport system permease protein